MRKGRPWGAKALLGLWVTAMVLLGTFALATHVAALPVPDPQDPRLRGAVASLRRPGRPLAVHALYADCRCSQMIRAHLARRGVMPGVDEVVLLVGDAPAHRARVEARGFRVLAVSDEELLRRWRMEAAPLLVVTDAGGVVRYAGGYRRAKSSAAEDPDVIRAVAAGRRPRRMPALGCPVSARLQARLDPIGLRTATPDPEGN
ncbi:MAG: hypothetical protein U0325_04535 [Polyangiales bacterium]